MKKTFIATQFGYLIGDLISLLYTDLSTIIPAHIGLTLGWISLYLVIRNRIKPL